MEMYDCPKFNHCSSPICPLFNASDFNSMHRDEKICFYLLEYQKTDSKAIFDGASLGEIYKAMGKVTEELFAKPDSFRYLLKRLIKASKTSSRILSGKRLSHKVCL